MNLLSSLLKFTADTLGTLKTSLTNYGTRLGTAETKVTNMEAQLATAISAVTVDSEVQNIRVGDDTVTYTSAGEAVRTQFSNVKSVITRYTGCEKIAPFTSGLINTSGDTADPDNPSTSISYKYAVVNCSAGDYFTISGTGANGARLWAFLDSSNNVISRSMGSETANNLILKAPANAVKLVLNDKTDSASYKGVVPTEYTQDNVNSLIQLMSQQNLIKSVNLYDKSACWSGIINTSDGTIASNADYITALYEVSPSDKANFYFLYKNYTDGTPTGEVVPRKYSARVLGFYDSTKKFLSSAENKTTYTIPSSAKYMAVSFHVNTSNMYGKNSDYYMVLVNNSEYPKAFIPYHEPFFAPNEEAIKNTDVLENSISGKVGVIFGDSIAQGIGSTWDDTNLILIGTDIVSVLERVCKCDVKNCAFGGTRYSNTGSYSGASFTRVISAKINESYTDIQSYINSITDGVSVVHRAEASLANLQSIDMSSVDFVLIMYGTNDWKAGVSADNSGNAFDTATILGGMRKGINDLLTEWSHLKVFILAPIFRNDTSSDTTPNGLGVYLYDVCEDIEKASNRLHLPCKNLYKESNISAYNSSVYLLDTVHPNDLGYERIGTCVANFLASNY